MNKNKIYTLLLVFVAINLSGCLDEPLTQFEEAPTATAGGVQFTDFSMGEGIGGTITIDRAPIERSFSDYVLRWDNGEYIGVVNRMEREATFELPPNSVMPSNASDIVVYASNNIGEAQEGVSTPAYNVLSNPNIPNIHPINLSFVDTDNSLKASGVLRWSNPVSGIENTTHYRVYFGDAQGCPIPREPITVKRAFYDSTFNFTVNLGITPPNAESIVVVANNWFGDAYEEDCSQYAAIFDFNIISETNRPTYPASALLVDHDSDPTKTYTGNITIKKAVDERDNGSGYYLRMAYHNYNKVLKYFPKNGQDHVYHFDRWLPEIETTAPDGSISVYNVKVEDVTLYVTVGAPDWRVDDHLSQKMDMANRNDVGGFFTIKNTVTGKCMYTSVSEPADEAGYTILRAVTCDPYEPSQRFSVEKDQDTNYYKIESEVTGGCVYRNNYGGIADWLVQNECEDNRNTQLLLEAPNETDVTDLKVAVQDGIFYSCATSYTTSDRVFGGWGGCGALSHIFWNFQRAGDSKDTAAQDGF